MVIEDQLVLYVTKETEKKVEAYMDSHSIWLSAENIAVLYDAPLHHVIQQIKLIYRTDSMSEFLTMQSYRVKEDGRERMVSYYNLQMILAIGNHLQAEEMTHFYKWAIKQLNNQ